MFAALDKQFYVSRFVNMSWPNRMAQLVNREFDEEATKSSVVYCDAGVSSVIGTTFYGRTDKRIVGTVHGLDITAPVPAYQRLIRRVLRRLDRVVCVSRATAHQAEERGVDPERIRVIPNAAEPVSCNDTTERRSV